MDGSGSGATRFFDPNRHASIGVRPQTADGRRKQRSSAEQGIMSSLAIETLARWSLDGKTAIVTGGTKVGFGGIDQRLFNSVHMFTL